MAFKVVRKIQRENEAATLSKLMQKKATKEQVIKKTFEQNFSPFSQKVEEFKKSQEVWRKIEEEKVRLENLEIAKFSQSKEKWKEEVKCLIDLNLLLPHILLRLRGSRRKGGRLKMRL